ncbi:MAG: hypothetical protein IPM64_17415 [Phycisphaerales bacterium]|nr:hypothetical protein [Phycisphaerales bacterium]
MPSSARSRVAAYSKELDEKIAEANAKTAALEMKLRTLYAKLTDKKEVVRYVTEKADAHCVITDGFVRHHDAAASAEDVGPLPESAESGDVDRDSGIALSTVAATAAENYGKFHRCATALKAWEAWYPAVKETYEKHLTEEAIR